MSYENKENKKIRFLIKSIHLNFIICILTIMIIALSYFSYYLINEKTNGKFKVLKGTYGATAVVLNENEIFLPSAANGNFVLEQELIPAQIYNIKEKNSNL